MATEQALGLSSEAAKIRLLQDGPNQLVKESKTGPWLRVLKILSEPMLILLGIATAVSFLIAEPVEAAVLALMIGFIVLTTIYQEGKAEKALRALKSLSAPLATVQLPIAREAFSLGEIGLVEWLVLFALSYLSIAWFDVYKSLRPNALR